DHVSWVTAAITRFDLTPPTGSRRSSPRLGEFLELGRFEVGDRPQRHSSLGPMDDVVALALDPGGGRGSSLAGPGKQIDNVLVALVDERGDRAAGEIIEPPAAQREVLGREILDRRRKIDPPVKPRLDRVAVGGADIFEMAGLQGADVSADDL